MSKASSSKTTEITKSLKQPTEARSIAIAARGIKTASQFADLMSAMMSDVISGAITPAVGNAACNAGGKLLKVVEMAHKYGTTSKDNERVLVLAPSKEEGE
jgi:hypothetical protein